LGFGRRFREAFDVLAFESTAGIFGGIGESAFGMGFKGGF
jgi:hypothetical protein